MSTRFLFYLYLLMFIDMTVIYMTVYVRYGYLIDTTTVEFYLIRAHLRHTAGIVTFLFYGTYFVSTSDTDIVDLRLLSVIDVVFLSVHCLPAVLPSNSCEGFLWISRKNISSTFSNWPR